MHSRGRACLQLLLAALLEDWVVGPLLHEWVSYSHAYLARIHLNPLHRAFVQCVDRCQLSEELYETFRKLLTSLPFTATAEGGVVLDYADKKPEPPPDFRGQPCSTSSAWFCFILP